MQLMVSYASNSNTLFKNNVFSSNHGLRQKREVKSVKVDQDEHFMKKKEDENKTRAISRKQNRCTYSEYCDRNHNTS